MIPEALSVSDYLATRDLHERLVVVELNGQILKRAEFPSAQIAAGDQIEIVHFVGGG
jgi:sulfur carrier protein